MKNTELNCRSGGVHLTPKNRDFDPFEGSPDPAPTPDFSGFVEWVECPLNPQYEVSNTGQVRRAVPGRRTRAGRVVKQQVDRHGYLRVTLGRVSYLAHRLVALTFIGECPPDMTVDHLDGDKTNNHATNLEYVTREENLYRGWADDRFPRGQQRPNAKLTNGDVRAIKQRIESGDTNVAIADDFGVSDKAISKIRHGQMWAHVDADKGAA